jgi:hypothetical protein
VLTLASLFMPWQRAGCSDGGGDPFAPDTGSSAGLANLFLGNCQPPIDGWSSVGEVATLAAVLLVALAALTVARPQLESRLPLAQAAGAVAFFTIALVAHTRLDARRPTFADAGFHTAYGTYVGAAAALLALAAACVLRRDELALTPTGSAWVPIAGGLGLLTVLLVPWTEVVIATEGSEPDRIESLGVAAAAGVPAAVLALRFLVIRWRDADAARVEGLVLSAAMLLFVGGAVAVDTPVSDRPAAWVGLGIAVALLGLVLAERPWESIRLRPTWLAAGAGAALVLLGVSLFLPWQRACYEDESVLRDIGASGRCLTANGWRPEEAALGMVVALALVAVVLALALRAFSRTELAFGLALLVATLGFGLETGNSGGVELEVVYGAVVGFVAAAVLVGLALAPVRIHAVDWSGRRTAVPGVLLGAAYVALVVLPWWNVLPDGVWSTFSPGLARLSWMTLAAALLALRLAYSWATRLAPSGAPRSTEELVLLALALTSLVVLDALRRGLDDLTWNTALLGSLAVALTVLGLVERAGGFDRVHVPDLLRIDRV